MGLQATPNRAVASSRTWERERRERKEREKSSGGGVGGYEDEEEGEDIDLELLSQPIKEEWNGQGQEEY